MRVPRARSVEWRMFHAAVPNWNVGDTIHLGHRTLRVVGIQDEDADQPPALVVEDAAERASSAAG